MRMWIATSGSVDEGVVFYAEDLPTCCQRTAGAAGGFGDGFECPACGAVWDAVRSVEAEADAFMTRGAEERKGAA